MSKDHLTSKQFYLLDYFYILLKSFERRSDKDEAFLLFKELKKRHYLGESKYRVNQREELDDDGTDEKSVSKKKERYIK